MGWSGIENGRLLQLTAENRFDAFISTDKGLEYEQNRAGLAVAVVVMLARDNRLATLELLTPLLLRSLKTLKPGNFVKVASEDLAE